MALSFAVRAALVSVIVLRFDGSLRFLFHPAFPGGTSSARVATCAACISAGSNDDQILLGGRRISCRTSAEAEYEGLILGLQGLLRVAQENDFPAIVASPATGLVTIHGDCRKVLQQMSTRARPRKLVEYYNRATSLVDQLPWKVRFEHIPRDDNILCDRLCARISLEEERAALVRAWAHLEDILSVSLCVYDADQSTRSLCTMIEDFLQKHFSFGKSLVPFASRRPIFQMLALAANEASDFESLMQLGKKIQEESKGVKDSSHTAFKKELVRMDGLVYEMVGLRGLGMGKKAESLARRNRRLLDRFSNDMKEVERCLERGSGTRQRESFFSEQRELALEAANHAGSDWPTPVEHWYEQASRADDWHEGKTFWTTASAS